MIKSLPYQISHWFHNYHGFEISFSKCTLHTKHINDNRSAIKMNGFERSPAIMTLIVIMISACFRCEDDKARRGNVRGDNGILGLGPVNLGEDNYFHR